MKDNAKFSRTPNSGHGEAAGTALLAECAVKDRIWGIGLSIMTQPGSIRGNGAVRPARDTQL